MENYRGKNKKKLFSIYRIYDYEKEEHLTLMHVYKRNLTPIRENYQQCTPTTPFEDNFVVFSNNFGHHHFKQEYMNLHGDNVHVNSSSKNKHF